MSARGLLLGLALALWPASDLRAAPDPRPAAPPEPRTTASIPPDAPAPSEASAAPAGFRALPLSEPPEVHALLDEDERLYDPSRLREIRIHFEAEDWQALLARNRRAGDVDAPARLEVDGRVLERVGVRYKGNTSLNVQGPKKPFNLSIDAFEPGQELLGYDVVNLNNGWGDPSMQREAAAYRLLRDYMPIPQSAFARVWVGERYLGVYLMVEQIERTFLEAWFPGSGGLLIKADNPEDTQLESSTLGYFGDLQLYRRGYELKSGYRDETEAYRTLQDLSRALDAPARQGGIADEDFEQAIREWLDVDAALWYLAANNLLLNYDSYYAGHNYYLHQEPVSRRFALLNWDWNLSFGTFQSWFGSLISRQAPPAPETDPFDQAERGDRPLIRRLLGVPSYRADYVAHLRTLRDEVLAPAHLAELAEAGQDLVREAVRAETEGIYDFEDFERNLREELVYETRIGPRVVQTRIPGLLDTAAARHAFLSDAERWPELRRPRLELQVQGIRPERPSHEDPVEVAARFEGQDAPVAVELRYRAGGGPETRLPMRLVEDGAWRVDIPPQDPGRELRYVLRARTADGRAVFFPAATLTRPFRYRVSGVELPERPAGDLVINELMADNRSTLRDGAGDYEDWLELYNRGPAPIGLAGYFLSDDPELPWQHALPPLTLAPGERLLVWCDGAPEEGPDHAPFRLDKDGEQVLLASREAIVDRLDYGALAADRSWGRATDGAETWARCDQPTPGTANDCRRAGWPAYLPRLER